MASDREKAHMRAIAQAMEEENRAAAEADGLCPPGENIERGLKLSAFALAAARELGAEPPPKDDPVPPIAIWRALQARRSGRGRDPERGP